MGFVYTVSYGYLKDVKAPDGEDLDAYIIGVNTPLESYEGVCIAIIHRTKDDDDKLVVVPENSNFNDEEIERAVNFQEQWFEHEIVRD
jgi:inorganic pyrophosphatase